MKRRDVYNRPYISGTEEAYTIVTGDNEASITKNISDVSFVLERKTVDSNGSSPGKLGLFSIALVMCVCCLS